MKTLFALLLAATLALSSALPSIAADKAIASTAAPAAQKVRVVIQVSDPDPRLWAQAINYTENLRELVGKNNVETEIVALGQGIGLLKLDSPHAVRVAEALKAGVAVTACGSTMSRQKLTREDMLPNIGYAPGGILRIIERQKEGWTYIKG
jgi:intracellular sulfur oxidation DsrE/DsrF family protein